MDANPALSGVQRFYLREKNRSHGGDYVYLLSNDRLYCSGVKEDFGRFLKDHNFLKNPDAALFQKIMLELNRFQDQLIIEQKDLDKPDEGIAPFVGKITAPKLVKTEAGGAAVTFFTQMVSGVSIQKFVVTAAPDYTVAFDHSFVG